MSLVSASLQLFILPQRPRSNKNKCSLKNPKLASSPSPISVLPNIISLALALSLTSSPPALAIPSLSSSQPLTTPFTQAKFLQTGLLNGMRIDESDFVFLRISIDDTRNRYTEFSSEIKGSNSEKPKKNPKFVVLEDTPYGKYLEAEVEGGGFSRDVMEFLVKQDVVAYRCVATKVTFVYPFTTAFGDSKGQEERMKRLVDELGWYAPSFKSMH